MFNTITLWKDEDINNGAGGGAGGAGYAPDDNDDATNMIKTNGTLMSITAIIASMDLTTLGK